MNQQVKIEATPDPSRTQEAIAEYVGLELEAIYDMCEKGGLQRLAAKVDAARQELKNYADSQAKGSGRN
jgi:hypothetical protein